MKNRNLAWQSKNFKERCEDVINETQRISQGMIGKVIPQKNVVVTYMAPHDYAIGKFTEKWIAGEQVIIFDRYCVEYGSWDIVFPLIVHECCRLKHGKERRPEHQTLFNEYCGGSFELTERPEYPEFIKLLEQKGLYKDGRWVGPPEDEYTLRLKKLIEDE